MNCVQESVQNMVGSSLDAATSRPVVTAPGSVLEEVAAAIVDADGGVRIVVPEGALEAARWVPRGRLADAVAAGSELRTADVDGLAVVGEGVAATVDGTATPPTMWVDDDPDETVLEAYADVWRAGVETELDAARAEAVWDAVAEVGGEEAVEDLETVTRPTRDGDCPEAIAAAVWAGAGSSPLLEDLRETIAQHLDYTERTVERRIKRLRDAGLLGRTYEEQDGDGRSKAVIVRLAEPPLGRPVRAVLSQ